MTRNTEALAATESPYVELRVWETSASDERHARATIVDPDTLPASVLGRCSTSGGSILLTALHALTSGPDANPTQPYKVELTFGDLAPSSTTNIILCAALPNRDQVLIQTPIAGTAKGAPLAADDHLLNHRAEISINS